MNFRNYKFLLVKKENEGYRKLGIKRVRKTTTGFIPKGQNKSFEIDICNPSYVSTFTNWYIIDVDKGIVNFNTFKDKNSVVRKFVLKDKIIEQLNAGITKKSKFSLDTISIILIVLGFCLGWIIRPFI